MKPILASARATTGTVPRVRRGTAAQCVIAALVGLGGGCAVDQAGEVGAYRDLLDIGPAPGHEPDAPLSLEAAARLTNEAN